MSDIDADSIQINLNSKFAVKYINGSHCNCVFELPSVQIPSQHHIHISVVNAIIPYSFYNINLSNNILIYIVGGVSYTLNIPIGNYNSIQLASYLSSNMAGFTCTYNVIPNTFTFTHLSMEFTLTSISTILKTIGFYNTDMLSSSYKLSSTFCANLQNVQCIHIKSNFMTGNINSSDIYVQDTICTIPVNTPPNSNIVYQNTNKFSSNLYSNILNDIVIKIVNQDNALLDLNGLDWSITLQLDIVDFVN
jgi:hypothetical protein